jgi:hypothetical protein
VFQISFPQIVQKAKYEKSVHSWWRKNVVLNMYCVLKNILHFLYFSFPNVTLPSMLHFLFIFAGTGFEVLTVVRINIAVWVRTPCSLVVHAYECFSRQSEDGESIHPPHRPDLAPSDFHLFLHLKKHLAGQKFHEDEEVENEVTTWLRAQAAGLYDIGIQKLVPGLNKCLDKSGDCVET